MGVVTRFFIGFFLSYFVIDTFFYDNEGWAQAVSHLDIWDRIPVLLMAKMYYIPSIIFGLVAVSVIPGSKKD